MSSFTTVLLSVLCCTVCFSLGKGDASFPEDTYINALQNSHQTDTDYNGDFGGYNYTPPPNNQYLPPSTPAPVYGPPAPVYGPPAPVYGPPQPTYYKPVPYPYHPRDHLSLLHKLKTKINLFTIGKIILKLLIFKKIVKFIGVICLLLFLPKLKDMFKEEPSSDEDGMESKQVETEQDVLEKRIEEVYDFAMKAFEKFQENTA
ncbi:hypothetical protein FF38_04437 [Lucilia cuprina]|uniref:DUF4794 domain-containing protein n=1 Tax=Lucilia cuprina TaxID=7375 RepID=A0A0L0C9E9_LUCCU|nr:hypothetical protein CVS40_12924 [Lucilia cuprina]KNC28064.1 hypothetical protein FF38_04437 [Lucilia cuprina]